MPDLMVILVVTLCSPRGDHCLVNERRWDGSYAACDAAAAENLAAIAGELRLVAQLPPGLVLTVTCAEVENRDAWPD